MSYIDKEKLLEKLQFRLTQYASELFDECGFEGGGREAIEEVVSDVEDMLDEDVHPKRCGHWILHNTYRDYDGDILATYKCSRCSTLNDEETPYCPKCGSKMRKLR